MENSKLYSPTPDREREVSQKKLKKLIDLQGRLYVEFKKLLGDITATEITTEKIDIMIKLQQTTDRINSWINRG